MTEMEMDMDLAMQSRVWADNPEPDFSDEGEPREVAECERCGDSLKDSDESLAIVGLDGNVHHFCQSCLNHARWFPESVITDILEAAGIYYATGWADEADDACRGAAERQKAAGVPAKRVIMIQKGVST